MSRHMIALGAAGLALAPALLVGAQPAMARDSSAEGNELAKNLTDPAAQARLANAMTAMTHALLAMPVGSIAEAMRTVDPDAAPRSMPRDATLGDMVARDNPDFEPDLDGKVRRGTRMAGAMAGAMAQMLPAIQQAMRGVIEGVQDGMAEAGN